MPSTTGPGPPIASTLDLHRKLPLFQAIFSPSVHSNGLRSTAWKRPGIDSSPTSDTGPALNKGRTVHRSPENDRAALRCQWHRESGPLGRRKDHRWGDSGWFRLTDSCAPGAKSVFDFNPIPKQSEVATHTYAGLPWLLDVREKLEKAKAKVHFWPFDGWKVCEGYSVIAEVYPALWKSRFDPRPTGMSKDKYDAYVIAAWLSWADRNGLLCVCLQPELTREECKRATKEGWILGALKLISVDIKA